MGSRPSSVIEFHRSEIWRMRHDLDMKQADIAEALGISQATVSRELKFMRNRWTAKNIQQVDKVMSGLLEELSAIKGEAIQAFRRSQEVVITAKGDVIEADLPGDPRYLSEWRQVLQVVAKMLGLDSPGAKLSMETVALLTLMGIQSQDAVKQFEAMVKEQAALMGVGHTAPGGTHDGE